MRRWVLVAMSLVVLALAAILLFAGDGPRTQLRGSGEVANDAVDGGAERNSAGVGKVGHGKAPELREAVAMPTDALPAAEEWAIQLVGIDPSVPWTAPLQLVLEERARVECAIDANGACRFVPPAYALLPGVHNLRLLTSESNYRLEQAYQQLEPLRRTRRAEYRVYPAAVLQGRVRAPTGEGVLASVSAFVLRPEGPTEPLLSRTTSDMDGRYELRVPPGVSLLVIAEAVTQSALLPWQVARPQGIFELERSDSLDEMSMPDLLQARTDLLPATARAQGAHGSPRLVDDLWLGATAPLTGTLTLLDGRPLRDAEVVAVPVALQARMWRANQFWVAGEGLLVGASTRTDAAGAFTMRLPSGRRFRVLGTSRDPLLLAGEPAQEAMAPGHLELVAPGELVQFRVLFSGKPAPRAWVDVGEGAKPWPADDRGSLRATLPGERTRVEARSGVLRSEAVELVPGEHSGTVDLHLLEGDLAVVRVAVHSRPPLLAAQFSWASTGDGHVLQVVGERANETVPFELRVPVGTYHLTVSHRPDEPGGQFLVPLQLDVEVAAGGVLVERDALYGGRLLLDVREDNGVRPAGHFVLRNALGQDVTPGSVVRSRGDAHVEAPGVLQVTGESEMARLLEPGLYQLEVEADGQRTQQSVTIKAWNYTKVQLRLP